MLRAGVFQAFVSSPKYLVMGPARPGLGLEFQGRAQARPRLGLDFLEGHRKSELLQCKNQRPVKARIFRARPITIKYLIIKTFGNIFLFLPQFFMVFNMTKAHPAWLLGSRHSPEARKLQHKCICLKKKSYLAPKKLSLKFFNFFPIRLQHSRLFRMKGVCNFLRLEITRLEI